MSGFRRVYRYTATVILLITAAGKILSVIKSEPIVSVSDPLLQIPNWLLLSVAAAAECLVVGCLWMFQRKQWPYVLSSALGATFLVYHALFSLGRFSRGCPCLGELAGWAPMSDQALEWAVRLMAAWLFIGGACASLSSQSSAPRSV